MKNRTEFVRMLFKDNANWWACRLANGGLVKGPAVCPSATSLAKLFETMVGLSMADFKFFENLDLIDKVKIMPNKITAKPWIADNLKT